MESLAEFSLQSPLLTAFVASIVGGLVPTTLGALPVMLIRSLSPRLGNTLLAAAAGVMLAATIFSLLLPGFEAALARMASREMAALGIIVAMGAGGAMMALLHRLLPHEHFEKGVEGPEGPRFAQVWLFVLAIAVHNFPEGLSIGVASASGDTRVGLGVTLGIGMQNVPEGLTVAMAMIGLGYSRLQALGVAALTGGIEVLGAMAGAGLLAVSQAMLPGALAFAAGTMLFVISGEVIPETHRAGFGNSATAALFVGFALMFFLDVALA